MDDEFRFPDADLYHHVYNPAPPSDPSKSILSLPTEIIVDIARLNFKTAVALMCTTRVLHAAGVTALYARVFLSGWRFNILDPDAPNLVPGVLRGLLVKQEHTAALRYLRIISVPRDARCRFAFMTLVYRVFERAHGLVCVDLKATRDFISPRNIPQLPYPRNLHTLHLASPTDPFAPHLLTAPSLKEVRFSDPCYWWDNYLVHDHGPYSQVTSLRYIHQGVGPNTEDGDSLKFFELFPSVERIEVKVGELREVSGEMFRGKRVECVDMGDLQFIDCVPHIGSSWARVKHLSLVDAWIRFDDGQPPVYERTKRLLIGALNALCPALKTGEVRCTSGYVMWRVASDVGGWSGNVHMKWREHHGWPGEDET